MVEKTSSNIGEKGGSELGEKHLVIPWLDNFTFLQSHKP